MRTVKWNVFLSGLCGFAMALGVVAAGARADVTSEKAASILVFPKVRVNAVFDTIIQITNTGNSMVHAKCYYVDATLTDTITGAPCERPSLTCAPNWQETDFTIWLTKQQPTHWSVSTGRRVDPLDGFGHDGSGFDPGHVPPMPDFEGELKCIEVTESEEPVTGNHLKGEGIIKTVSGDDAGDVSKYNAVGIQGNPDAQPANPLLLDGNIYDACPSRLILNHITDGDRDLVVPADSSVHTELTLVPCSEDFENQIAKSVTIQFLVFNEFEERFSASTTVDCYLSVDLSDIDSPTSPNRSVFSAAVLNSDAAHTEITPVAQADGSNGGLVGVVERTISVGAGAAGRSARVAYGLHTSGSLIPAVGPDSVHLTERE